MMKTAQLMKVAADNGDRIDEVYSPPCLLPCPTLSFPQFRPDPFGARATLVYPHISVHYRME